MKNFELYSYTKNATTLMVKKSSLTDDAIKKKSRYYLSDHFVTNQYGRVAVFYQFHTKNYHSLNDTMVFDIECPKCHTNLKINRLGSDGYNHSFYHCPKCHQLGGKNNVR